MTAARAVQIRRQGKPNALLGPDDEPCDPLARVIQTWNPVQIDPRTISRVLAQLRPARDAHHPAPAAAFGPRRNYCRAVGELSTGFR